MSDSVSVAAPRAVGVPVTNGKVGLWLFLSSEIMFFSGLIGAYVVYRYANPEAFSNPEFPLSWPLAALNTVILITSSVTMVFAVKGAQEQDIAKMRKFLFLTMLGALGFCVVKGIEYEAKFSHGIGPDTSLFYSCYFTMTGIHALHVILGLLPMFFFWWKGKDGRYTTPGNCTIECLGLYWHFVDLVWIYLFPLLYLLP